MKRIIVGVSGASGSIYGIRLLQRLHERPDVESHLIVTRAGEKTMHQETGYSLKNLKEMASHSYSVDEIGASIASGSSLLDGMAICPCSINTMSAIATGIASNLLVRAADVTLKERRRLILVVRETPLHLGHLRTMAAVTEMGAIIAPPMPAFYNNPKTIDEIVDQGAGRILDLFGLESKETKRWEGV